MVTITTKIEEGGVRSSPPGGRKGCTCSPSGSDGCSTRMTVVPVHVPDGGLAWGLRTFGGCKYRDWWMEVAVGGVVQQQVRLLFSLTPVYWLSLSWSRLSTVKGRPLSHHHHYSLLPTCPLLSSPPFAFLLSLSQTAPSSSLSPQPLQPPHFPLPAP